MTESPVRLRVFREERGWTQRDVADHVQRLAWVKHGDHVGVNADMVAKWERGAKGVSTYYRELLALLFGVEPRILGLRTGIHGSEIAAGLDGLARDAADLMDRLGAGVDVIRPGVMQVLEDQITRRRTLLAVVGLLPMSPDELSDSHSASSSTFDDLCDRYQHLYHSSDPAALLTVSLAHLDAVTQAARVCRAGGERARLIANRARSATLVGRVSFFDLDDPMAARSHYAVAVEAAGEAGDARMQTAALAHFAFIPAAEGAPGAALDYLARAKAALADEPHAVLSSWVQAVESEVLANAGDHAAALDAVDRARDAISSDHGDDVPRWFDYYDGTRLAGFAGYANLLAGRYDAARVELENALGLPLAAAKQRSVLLADLATVHYHDGELDEACRIAISAVDELARAGYATGSDRVRSFLRLVHPHADTPAVRTLNERVSSLN